MKAPLKAGLFSFATQNKKEKMIDTSNLFMEIVQIDSQSGDEQRMVDFVHHFLATECNLNSEIDGHNNIFIQTQGIGEPIFLNAHLDTVSPGEGIVPILNNGIITSAGDTILGADNKGAVSALLSALKYRNQNPQINWRPLDVLFTTSEEVGCYGAVYFDKSKIRASRGYIFDGTGDVGTVMIGSPFYARFDVKIIGKSAHAGFPEDSVPAIPTMLELVNKLHHFQTRDSLITIGVMGGGEVRNAIMGQVCLEGEVRSFHQDKFIEAIEEIKNIFNHKYQCELQTEIVVENAGYEHSAEEIGEIKKLMKDVLGYEVFAEKNFGVSDANIFNDNDGRLTVFNLGDGTRDAHTVDESISIKSLELMFDAYLKLSKY